MRPTLFYMVFYMFTVPFSNEDEKILQISIFFREFPWHFFQILLCPTFVFVLRFVPRLSLSYVCPCPTFVPVPRLSLSHVCPCPTFVPVLRLSCPTFFCPKFVLVPNVDLRRTFKTIFFLLFLKNIKLFNN